MPVLFKQVDGDIWSAQYSGWHVLFLKSNGFVNATKLCLDGGKMDVEDWIAHHLKLIRACVRHLFLDGCVLGIYRCRIELSGSYFHPLVIQHTAASISPECAVVVGTIVHECFQRSFVEKLTENMLTKARDCVNKNLAEQLLNISEK